MGLTFNVTEKSHVDHMPSETLNVVREIVRDGESKTLVAFPGFQIHSVELPAHLDSVPSALRGPVTGEAPVAETDVFYGTRGDRPNISRLTKLGSVQSRTVTRTSPVNSTPLPGLDPPRGWLVVSPLGADLRWGGFGMYEYLALSREGYV